MCHGFLLVWTEELPFSLLCSAQSLLPSAALPPFNSAALLTLTLDLPHICIGFASFPPSSISSFISRPWGNERFFLPFFPCGQNPLFWQQMEKTNAMWFYLYYLFLHQARPPTFCSEHSGAWLLHSLDVYCAKIGKAPNSQFLLEMLFLQIFSFVCGYKSVRITCFSAILESSIMLTYICW